MIILVCTPCDTSKEIPDNEIVDKPSVKPVKCDLCGQRMVIDRRTDDSPHAPGASGVQNF